MTPVITTQFDLVANEATVTDTFNYAALTYDAIYGNVIAKYGNTPFHSNIIFTAGNSDTEPPGDTTVTFDLPLDESGEYPILSTYNINYKVLIEGEVLQSYLAATAAASPITQAVLGVANPTLLASITTWLNDSTKSNLKCRLYNSSNALLGTGTITGVSGTTLINFSEVTYSGVIAKIQIVADSYYETDFVYDFDLELPTAALNATFDCFYAKGTFLDTTVYPSDLDPDTPIVRTMTIQFPRLANGSTVETTVITSAASYTVTTDVSEAHPWLWTGGYTLSLSTNLQWVQDDGLIITATITAFYNPNVQCDVDMCCMRDCISTYREKYLAALRSGSRNLTQLQTDNIVINSYWRDISLAIQCANTSDAYTLITELKAYMKSTGCDCGCSDTASTDAPRIIYPLYSPQA